MRAISLFCLLLLGSLCLRPALGQTFDSPWTFNANPYVSSNNTCAMPPQAFYLLDVGYAFNAPTVVYRVFNFYIPNHPIQYHVRHVTLSPNWVDLSIWVCANRSGNTVWNCSDGSDNGFNAVNQVTVPATIGAYYVIITGNIDNAYPQCGPYTLTEYY